MKKALSVLLAIAMLCSSNTTVFAASNKTNSNAVNVAVMAENNSTITGQYKEYTPFVVNNQEIRLYAEPVMTEREALETYAAAFEMCAEKAEVYGIIASLDNAEFVNFAKIYAAMNENGTVEFVNECKNFAVYLDYYENIAINQQILNAVSLNTRSSDWSDIEALMPSASHATIAAGETVHEDETSTAGTRATTYNTSAAVAYAEEWWNKTNNTDYPYYAKCKEMDTSSNDYNDLDEGRPGQSNPARGWYDCADFVSQCLAAGGVPQIKSGSTLTHLKAGNWYYNNDKPSNTWGGADNFYKHWKDRAGIASSSADLGVGDAVSFDIGNDGSPDHTLIIVSAGSTDSTKYLASHTVDRNKHYYANGRYGDFTLPYLYGNGWTVYGYEIDKIF